jgi:hypothetical protein
MSENFYDRRHYWSPMPRPEWVATLNEKAQALDLGALIPLTPQSLITQAQENTGLTDFGDGQWRQHLQVLLDAIETEANLHCTGRMLTRSEFVRYLEARLQLVDCLKQNPAIGHEKIDKPLFITGYGRSGTTILFEVLSQDPQFRVPQKWESLFPCPPPETASYETDMRIAKTARISEFSESIIPELQAIHKIAANLPVESVELVYLTFLSEVFPMAFQIPSYAKYLETQDLTECFAWQKRILQVLQYRHKKPHWLLKGPSHLPYLFELLKVYPDARIIFTHRDPIITADSVQSLLGSLYWWRTDTPWGNGSIDTWALAQADERAAVWDPIIDSLENGSLANAAVSNVQYDEFIKQPMQAVRNIYQDLELELSSETEAKMLAFLEARPKGKYGEHIYSKTPPEVIARERLSYQRYQQYFAVPNELKG